MANPTILQITQEVLSEISSDEVNSISDTVESEQVARLIMATYRNMMSNRNWAHQMTTINLVASGSSDRPTHMTIPQTVKEVISVYYDKRKSGETRLQYKEIFYKEQDEFLRLLNSRNSDDTDNVKTVTDTSGIKLLISKASAPTYYTSFDDNTLVFDSYDSDIDNTLQANKTQARVYKMSDPVMADGTILEMPKEAFAELIEKVKSRASFKFAEKEDQYSELDARRQSAWEARKNWRVNSGKIYTEDYGRK